MNDLDKLDLIGGIDTKYINEAEASQVSSRRNLRKILIPAAACLCLVAVGLVIHGANAGKQPTQTAGNMNTQTAVETPGVTAGGEDEQSPDEKSGIIYNGAQVPGEDPGYAVFNGAELSVEEDVNSGNNDDQVPGEDPKDPEKTVFNGAQVPGEGNDNDHSGTHVPWISSYGDPSYDPELIVENGKAVLSDSLKKAIDEWYENGKMLPGDSEPRDAVFRAEVIFFKDGKKLENDSLDVMGEEKRLIINGYTVAEEELQQDGVTVQLFWTLHATADQLLNFEPMPGLGYYIVLYDEYTGIESVPYAVYNGADVSD